MLEEKEKSGKSLKSKLLEDKAKKIVRLIEKGDTKKALSLIDGMNEKLSDNPEIIAKNILYIVEKISDDKIKMILLEKILKKEDILKNNGQYEILCEYYKQVLQIKPDHYEILNNYGVALGELRRYEEAIEKFEKILQIKPDYYGVLNNYGLALLYLERYEEAIEKFEKALKIKQNDYSMLNDYSLALFKLGRYEEAIEKSEKVLHIKTDCYQALNRYGAALFKLEQYEEAIEKFEKALQIKPYYYTALANYGKTLLRIERYSESIDTFKKILAIESENNDVKLTYFFAIGILYYRLKDEIQADKYFKLVIEHFEDKDAARIFIAQNIFAADPYSQKGIDILKEITEASPQYSQASDMLALNLSSKEFWEAFSPRKNSAEIRDNEMLNRAIYHKIKNEISILKAIVYEIISDYQGSDNTFRNIIDNINHIVKEIELRRNTEKQQIREFPSNDYEKIIKIISDTAHDISDFVNNELAIIEADVRDLLSELNADNPLCKILQELLTQIKITQGALNDLKAINEGIKINQSGFYVKELFENWGKNQKLQHASISLDIQNGESFFYGDKQKIRGFLNELVDNAIKHNPDKKDLEIRLWSRDETNPSPMFPDDIVGRHLLIGCSDNGKGILPDKKKTIFLPLETTSDTGSGLGLFIIKRTLKEMNGYIQETGEHGANFEIYIPYDKGETQ